MHDFSKVIFFCFILLFSFSALCLDTKTKNIHYFFFGNDFSQDEVIPLPPVSGCHLTASDCTGSTPFFDAENCTCYCDKTSSDCLEDEIFNENYCQCVLDCLNGVDNNGDCCPPDNYDLANCITTGIEKNGCYTYISDCTDGKVCNGNGNCVCPDNRPVWTGTACVECSIPTNLTCPIASEEVDENGCPLYREKVCEDGEILNDCNCVERQNGSSCNPETENCQVDECLPPKTFECIDTPEGTGSNGSEWKETGEETEVWTGYHTKDGTKCYNIQKKCAWLCPEEKPHDYSGYCCECQSDEDCWNKSLEKPYCSHSNTTPPGTCVECMETDDCNPNDKEDFTCSNHKCVCLDGENEGSITDDGNICCAQGKACGYECCGQEEYCYNGLVCCPITSEGCGTTCCKEGYSCFDPERSICCLRDYEELCNGVCCMKGNCCREEEGCTPPPL